MPKSEQPSQAIRQDDRAIHTVVYQMIVLMNVITRPFNVQFGAEHGISLSEWRCIMWLAASPGATGQGTALGTGMDRMNVSRNLRTLEQKSMVTRTEDTTDRKRWKWQLEPKGWAVYDAILPSALERDEVLTKHLDPDARKAILTFFASSLENLETL